MVRKRTKGPLTVKAKSRKESSKSVQKGGFSVPIFFQDLNLILSRHSGLKNFPDYIRVQFQDLKSYIPGAFSFLNVTT